MYPNMDEEQLTPNAFLLWDEYNRQSSRLPQQEEKEETIDAGRHGKQGE